MKILVVPDIHGRRFWEIAKKRIKDCDLVVFLGDYLDPYNFEFIEVSEAIENFRDIMNFAHQNPDRVVLLLGNHDLPYYSEDYRGLVRRHSRWSREWHEVIKGIFDANHEMFKLAHVVDDVLFTHAGCSAQWLNELGLKPGSLCELESCLNALLATREGLLSLFMVSHHRGGFDDAGSCVWAHVTELVNDYDGLHFADCPTVKQVFGHTLQVLRDDDRRVFSGNPITTSTLKMLDTRCAYVLDTVTFEHSRAI